MDKVKGATTPYYTSKSFWHRIIYNCPVAFIRQASKRRVEIFINKKDVLIYFVLF